MLVTWIVHLWFQGERVSGKLLTIQDGEVVISIVNTSVTLGTNSSTEEDEVFGNGRVQDDHVTHGSTSVVENPVLEVEVINKAWVSLLKLWSQGGHDLEGISTWVGFQGFLNEILKNLLVEDIVVRKPCLERGLENRKEYDHDGGKFEPDVH